MISYYRLRYGRGRNGRAAAAGAAAVLLLAGHAAVRHHHYPGGGGPWAVEFLTGAHLPATACDLATVAAWRRAEGSNPAWRNPLDTTQPEPGSSPVNADGVQAYPSRGEGLAASITTIGYPAYAQVRAAFRSGDAQATADAIAASPWGTQPFGVNC